MAPTDVRDLGRQIHDEGDLRVPRERFHEHLGQLGLPKGHMGLLLLGEGHDALAQGGEAGVDRNGLAVLLVLDLRFLGLAEYLQALAAGQVDEVQVRDDAPVPVEHLEHVNGVRAGGVGVHGGRADVPVHFALGDQLGPHFGRNHLLVRQVEHHELPRLLAQPDLVRGREQVRELFVVNLEAAEVDLGGWSALLSGFSQKSQSRLLGINSCTMV